MIVVCGEALIDVFATGETREGVSLDGRIGGSPLNVAIGLARLDQPAAFLGSISTGFLGARLVRALRSEGVSTDWVSRVDAPTTLGLVGLDEAGVPSYAFYGEGGADRQLGLDALAVVTGRADAIHLGSFATVVEPIASTLRALVERERGRALLSYDPNLRLNVEPDLARWRATVDGYLARVDLLKVSAEDLSLLEPDTTAEAFAQRALKSGVALVVVTRGGAGAQAWTARGNVDVPGVPVAVIDTVGAGDSFQAALLAWLMEGGHATRERLAALDEDALKAALRFATRAAAITCSRRGADLPRRSELDAVGEQAGERAPAGASGPTRLR